MQFQQELIRTPAKSLNVQELEEKYKIFHAEIDDLVKKSIEFMSSLKESGFRQTNSEYLSFDNSSFCSCYVRAGCGKFGKFGHPTFCISNISMSDEYIGKQLFSTYVAIMTSICYDNNWIFYVENPLSTRFQNFLLRIGCQNNSDQGWGNGLGNYFFMLPDEKLISDDEYFGLRQMQQVNS